MMYPTNEVARDAVRGEAASADASGACGENVATLWIRPAPQTVQATATRPSSGGDVGSDESANGPIIVPPISRRAAATFSDRWRLARNP